MQWKWNDSNPISLRDWFLGGPVGDWTGGPAQQLDRDGHVTVEVCPGDMTRYEVTLTNIRDAGLIGKPVVCVAVMVPYGRTYGFGLVGAGSESYVADKLKIPSTHETAIETITLLTHLGGEVVVGGLLAARLRAQGVKGES